MPKKKVEEIKPTIIEKPENNKKEIKLHFEKYLLSRDYNKMQIAAVGSKIKKTDLKTAEEWDKVCNKIINMRLR